jgi:K(+)-stimulated pyrophosphate-energized sodium pump
MNILGLARHGLNGFEQIAIIGVVIVAIISLLYAWFLRGKVMAKDKGTAKMQEVWNAIRIGANSYLSRQLRSILPLILVLAVALFLSVYIVPPSLEAREWHCIFLQGADAHNIETLSACAEGIKEGSAAYQQTLLIIGIARMIAFIMGASFSLTVGQLGMRMAIQANVALHSAARRGFNEASRSPIMQAPSPVC